MKLDNLKRAKFVPMQLLGKLIPPCKNKMVIPYITMKKKTLKIIDKLPNTFCTGYDDVNISIIKKLKYKIQPLITHLINAIIDTDIFAIIFKLSEILPTLKPDKDKNVIESFRPLNNIPVIEKVID